MNIIEWAASLYLFVTCGIPLLSIALLVILQGFGQLLDWWVKLEYNYRQWKKRNGAK